MITTYLGGLVSWQAFVAFMVVAMGMGMLLSASALLLEEMSFHLYQKPRHLAVLLGAVLFENFGYRQLTAWWRLKAILLWLGRRPGSWGKMTRTASWQAETPQPRGAERPG